jgi:hypothetical protein
MSARDFIIRLGRELSEQDNAAFDLWTHLPSHKAADEHHGDYAAEYRPSVTNVLREAAIFISHKLDPTPEQIKEAGDYYSCPCGENHES